MPPRTRKPPPPAIRRRPPIPFLADLKSEPDAAAALRLLFTSPPDLHLDYPSCAAVLHRLGRSRLFPELFSLLRFIRLRRIPCREPIFSSAILHLGRSAMPDEAAELFRSIPTFNCPPSVPSRQTLNSLLSSLAGNGRLRQAESLIRSCSRDWNIRPNVVSYNIVISGRLSGDGGVESAWELFDEMRKRGICPSVATYNTLIGFLSRNGRLRDAVAMKEEMERSGEASPSSVTYALLMQGLCSAGEFDAARKMMFDMEYRGCRARPVNYGVLMHDRGRNGDFGAMKELLEEMKKRRMKPDVVVYGTLIGHLCQGGRASEAYEVFVEMQMEGCEPNAAVYRAMADGFVGAGEFERGLGVVVAMLNGGHCPRAESFGRLAAGLCGLGRMDEAAFVLEEMVKRRKMDSEGWIALVGGICGGGTNDATILLLDELTAGKLSSYC